MLLREAEVWHRDPVGFGVHYSAVVCFLLTVGACSQLCREVVGTVACLVSVDWECRKVYIVQTLQSNLYYVFQRPQDCANHIVSAPMLCMHPMDSQVICKNAMGNTGTTHSVERFS